MKKNKYLFVYGSLRRQSNHPMAVFLRNNAVYSDDGYITGTLFDLGEYPGAINDVGATSRVFGELYEIKNESYTALMEKLDVYEGYNPVYAEQCEFIRDQVTVYTSTARVYAQIYVYNGDETDHVITSGDYSRKDQ